MCSGVRETARRLERDLSSAGGTVSIWYDMGWDGTVRYGMVGYDIVRVSYGTILYCLTAIEHYRHTAEGQS